MYPFQCHAFTYPASSPESVSLDLFFFTALSTKVWHVLKIISHVFLVSESRRLLWFIETYCIPSMSVLRHLLKWIYSPRIIISIHYNMCAGISIMCTKLLRTVL